VVRGWPRSVEEASMLDSCCPSWTKSTDVIPAHVVAGIRWIWGQREDVVRRRDGWLTVCRYWLL
jgi:hypothetical protein